MDKKTILLLVLLVAMMIAWPFADRLWIRPHFAQEAATSAKAVPSQAPLKTGTAGAKVEETMATTAAQDTAAQVAAEQLKASITSTAQTPKEKAQILSLENENSLVKVSSIGGGIVGTTLKQYPETQVVGSGPVVLDFQSQPALVYHGLPGVNLNSEYTIAYQAAENGKNEKRAIVLTYQSPTSGLKIQRTVSFQADYLLNINDEIVNAGTQTLEVASPMLQMGPMERIERGGKGLKGGVKKFFGTGPLVGLGVDALSTVTDKVVHWGDKIAGYFEKEKKVKGRLPVDIVERVSPTPVDWVAVKSEYFAQILTPVGGGEGCTLYARRQLSEEETADPSYSPKMQSLAEVSAFLTLPKIILQPGQNISRAMTLYVGPTKLADLSKLGLKQTEVMELGIWTPICKVMLITLDAIHDWIWPHNYGLAIILLTVLVRIVFWPVTHKGTESMKRMSALQPLIKQINEKYKDNAQKKQQEIMALYREHKVNPVTGCLPMLIQMPVLFALFMVLRSAIELRYASFLWISDLSQPENLFAGVLPIPLNILPLVMAATMFWQQKLTPSTGDSQQQKIMAFMPLMMLFFFYNIASGLVLYWTTNQCLMIGQMLITKWQQAKQDAKKPTAQLAPKISKEKPRRKK